MSSSAVWLLDLELGGGRVLYLASEGADVPSRVAGGVRRYSPGLPDLLVDRGADGITLECRVVSFDAIRLAHGPLRGRRAVLRIWRGEAALEDAEVVLRGVVDDAAWGAPDGVDTLRVGISASSRASRTICSPDATVAKGTDAPWPDAHDDAIGATIPTVIGTPGASGDLGRWNDDAYPATPILCVESTGSPRTFAIADHYVDAATVTIYNTDDGTDTVKAVTNTIDGSGRRVATVSLGTAFAADGSEGGLFAAWTDGGGATWEGAPVRGLGSVLVWGATQFGGGPWDLGEQRGQAADLDRYLVDAVINDPGLTWSEWVDSALVDAFGLVRLEGRDGAYFARMPPVPDKGRARARLTTDPDGTLGHRVTRSGPYVEDDADEIASEVTVYYAQSGDGDTRRSISVVGREARRATEIEFAPCHAAAERGGAPLVRTIPTSDPATARLAALALAELHSVPGYAGQFVGSVDIAPRLRHGDTVEIEDGGVVRWGVVRGVRLGTRSTEITVRFA